MDILMSLTSAIIVVVLLVVFFSYYNLENQKKINGYFICRSYATDHTVFLATSNEIPLLIKQIFKPKKGDKGFGHNKNR